MQFNEHTTENALTRMLEQMAGAEDFKPWCESMGIDYEFMAEVADGLGLPEIARAGFYMGVAVAWETARHQ